MTAATATLPAMDAAALPLRTERLLLRGMVIDDVDDVHGYQRLPEVARFLSRPPFDLDATRAWVQRAAELRFAADGDWLVLAIQTHEATRVIGEVVLKRLSGADGQAELGYLLHPSVGRRGYATEAGRAVLDLAFRSGFHRVTARLDEENTASAAVCRRLGMRQEARLVDCARRDGRWRTELAFAVLEHEWRR